MADIDYATCNADSRRLGERNDCAIKALAIVLQIPYNEARERMKPHRVKSGGTKNIEFDHCLPLNNEVKKAGLTVKRIKCRSKTLKTLNNSLKSKETFLVYTGGPKRGSTHVSVWRSGILEDWAGSKQKRILSIWLVR